MTKQISLDNGVSYMTAHDAMDEIKQRNLWELVVMLMDDEIACDVHNELAPCTDEDYLTRYLELADNDLIIG